MKPTLVIGDCHGHLDRLEALLIQEGVLGECPECESNGPHDCPVCHGDGIARINHDVEIVQLGDFGHWGADGSPTGDILTTKACVDWCDVMLWGNHDRALIEPDIHAFGGYIRPGPEAFHLIALARGLGKLKLAHSSHGYLFTHAGLHHAFCNQDVQQYLKEDAAAFAAWLNANDALARAKNPQFLGIRDAIGRRRGGGSHAGGIIWRDITEKLYMGFPQIFGHSADPKHMVRVCAQKGFYRTQIACSDNRFSYCVDVGGKGDKPGDNCLAGIWLPDERIVRVDL